MPGMVKSIVGEAATNAKGMTTSEKTREQRLTTAQQSRRAFCGSLTRFTAALAFTPPGGFLASCASQPQRQQKIPRPPVQINNTYIIPNTRYIGEAFSFPEQMVSAILEPPLNRTPPYAQGISFIGIIAQDTLSVGYNSFKPYDIARVGLFKQNNGTFRYGYEINGVRHYARGHVPGLDYKYNINFSLNEEGLVTDPDYPHQRRFGYNFQISSGSDASIRLQGLQSAPIYANQIFVGVMDESDNVRLPDNKRLQLYISVSGSEQAPNVIYKNNDDTSQVSSQFSESENRIVLTLSGSTGS